MTDSAMTGTTSWETRIALHEIGHNWDNMYAEQESPIETEFLAISGWTQTDPRSTADVMTTRYGETWWYRKNESFLRGYSRSHPVEDFADSFAAYFMDAAGVPWYTGAARIPEKIQVIENWVATV